MPFEAEAAYIFTILLIVAGILVRRFWPLYILQVLWMILLLGGNTFSQDYAINEALYSAASTDTADFSLLGFAYQATAQFASQNGWDFVAYNMAIAIPSVLLITYIIYKHAWNYNLAFSLVYFYPFAEMVIQKRFLPAMALSLVALQYLNSSSWKSQLKFFFFWILAVGFHSAVIFYIVFWGLDLFTRHGLTTKKKYLLIAAWLALCFVSSFIPVVAGMIFPSDKIELYFETYAEKSNIFHFLFWAVLHISVVVLVWKVYQRLPRTRFSRLVCRLNLYSLFIIPLYQFDPVFIRYFRDVLIFDYMFLGDFFPTHLVMRKTSLYAGGGIILIGFAFCIIWYYLGIGNMTFERMIAPIFESNRYIL